jgi:peptidoglycan biosynthesis protein MviN/MurJ (putative lipid II flippase)
MGFRGLALGTAIAAAFNAGVLLWLLRRPLGGIGGRLLLETLIKVAAASAAMAVAAHLTLQWITGVLPGDGEIAKVIRVFGSIAVALVVLAASAKLMRIREFDEAVARVLGRLRRR